MKAKLWIALSIVFVSGAVVGFVGGRACVMYRIQTVLHRGPAAYRDMILARLNDKLTLDVDQEQRAAQVIGQATQDIDATRRAAHERSNERLKQALQDLRPFLRPDQLQLLDQVDVRDLRAGLFPRPKEENRHSQP